MLKSFSFIFISLVSSLFILVACSDSDSKSNDEPVSRVASSSEMPASVPTKAPEPIAEPAPVATVAPEPTKAAAPAPSPASNPAPAARESETAEPLVVIDALGQEVTFEKVPEKIASISPTATEMLYAAGGTAILRDRASNFPAEVQSLPDVGSAYDPSMEAILAISRTS